MTSPQSASRTPQRWDDDDQLSHDLATALRGLPPAPPEFVAAAEAALTWRTIDAELAELSYDSAADAGLLARIRSTAVARTLAFAGDGVMIELELTEAGIVGQISPAGTGQVYAESTAGIFAESPVDEIGCFLLAAPPAGPIRLRAEWDRFAVVTCWVRLA